MIGTLSLIPPHGDMTVTEYDGTAPDLAEVQDMVGSSFLNMGFVTTFEQNGVIVPSIAAVAGDAVELGLEVNEAAMILQRTSLLRENKSLDDMQEVRGNIVIGCGDQEFMDALDDLFPDVIPEPPPSTATLQNQPPTAVPSSPPSESVVGVPLDGWPSKPPNPTQSSVVGVPSNIPKPK